MNEFNSTLIMPVGKARSSPRGHHAMPLLFCQKIIKITALRDEVDTVIFDEPAGKGCVLEH